MRGRGGNELLKRENSENLTEKRGKNSQVEEGEVRVTDFNE